MVEIVEKVFQDLGFTDYKLRTSRNYRKLEYCVQHRETAFNFVSRLLEWEGVTWHPVGRDDQVREWIRDRSVEKQLQPSVYAHRDFDPLKSRSDLDSKATFPDKVPGHEWQIYDYPGSTRPWETAKPRHRSRWRNWERRASNSDRVS